MLAGYFLSKFGIDGPPTEMNVNSWQEAYGFFFESLNQGRNKGAFVNSLRNTRDEFDNEMANPRTGYVRPLARQHKDTIKQWGNSTRDEIWEHLKNYKPGWWEDIRDTIHHLGGRASFVEIKDGIEIFFTMRTNTPSWKEMVHKNIQRYTLDEDGVQIFRNWSGPQRFIAHTVNSTPESISPDYIYSNFEDNEKIIDSNSLPDPFGVGPDEDPKLSEHDDGEGTVYVIVNSYFENWVKIGCSKNLPIREKSYQTYSPGNYSVYAYIIFEKCYQLEQELHEQILRPNPDFKSVREWHNISKEDAIKIIVDSSPESQVIYRYKQKPNPFKP